MQRPEDINIRNIYVCQVSGVTCYASSCLPRCLLLYPKRMIAAFSIVAYAIFLFVLIPVLASESLNSLPYLASTFLLFFVAVSPVLTNLAAVCFITYNNSI